MNDRDPKIFLDMDGVLADFVTGASTVHDRDPTTVDTWNIHETWGLTHEEFWAGIDVELELFWSALDVYPWAKQLVRVAETVVGAENVFFLSSPSLSPASWTGKIMWVERHFPAYTRRTILTPNKNLLAHHNRLLIDDSDSNTYEFARAGGRVITFPQPWNKKRRNVDKRDHIIGTELHRFLADVRYQQGSNKKRTSTKKAESEKPRRD